MMKKKKMMMMFFLQIFKHQEDMDFVSFTIFNIVCVLDCVDTIPAFMELAI